MKYLALTVVIATVLAASAYYNGWPQDYESWTAQKKMDYLWKRINEDHSESSFPSIWGQVELAAPTAVGGIDLWSPGTHVSDQFPEGRPKAIHSVGKIAKGKFNWNTENVKKLGLTGGFTESVDMLIRLSSGTEPNDGCVPNIALKHLRTGVPSGNFMGGHGLRPQDNTNFFFNPLANHVPNRHANFSFEGLQAAVFNLVFTKGPEYHGIVGLSEFGRYTSDGKKADKIKVPFTIMFAPKEDVRKECMNVPLQGSNFGCLDKLKPGRALYTIYACMEPKTTVTKDDVHLLGDLVLTSEFVSSKFADEQLHFKHVFQPEESKLLNNGWYEKINPNEFMDTEGPEKYRQFIMKGDQKVRRRRLHH